MTSTGDVGLLPPSSGTSSRPSFSDSALVSRIMAQVNQSIAYSAQAAPPPGEVSKVQWTKVNDVPAFPPAAPLPRHGHRAIAYGNLMFVFGGGNEGIVEELYVFNITTSKWYQPPVTGDIPAGRAAFGMVLDDHRILMYGGMTEHCNYSSDLYEFIIADSEWRKLTPQGPPPCARFGHSFTAIHDKIYLFGGLANDGENSEVNIPRYLNDLYVLRPRENNLHGVWDLPVTFGSPPCPRESHSAVAYLSKDGQLSRLFVYGGMLCYRLGDMYMLNLDTMVWSKAELGGIGPSPRSLHSATVVGEKMYVFGGWVPMTEEELQNGGEEWKVSNTLACLNLETLQWENVHHQEIEEDKVPRGRAGHSAVMFNNRLYIWSGRDGYRKVGNNQVCLEDLWQLEVQKPGDPGKVQLNRSGDNWLEVGWNPVPGADSYVLQVMTFDAPSEPQQREQIFQPVPSSANAAATAARYTTTRPIMTPLPVSRPLVSTGWPAASSLYSLPANKASTASSLFASRSVARPLAIPGTSAQFSYQPSGRGVLQIRTPAQAQPSSSRSQKTRIPSGAGAKVLKTNSKSTPSSSEPASEPMIGMHALADVAALAAATEKRIQRPASGIQAMQQFFGQPQVFSEARRVTTMSGALPAKSAQFITTGGQIVTLNLPPGSYLPPGLLPMGTGGQQQQQISIAGKPVTLRMPEGQKMAFLPQQTNNPPIITLDQEPSKPTSVIVDSSAGQKPTIPTSTAVGPGPSLGSVVQPLPPTASSVRDEGVGVAAEGLIELAGGLGGGNQQQLVSGGGDGDKVNAAPVSQAATEELPSASAQKDA